VEIIRTILESTLPVFAIVAVGAIYGRRKELPARQLSDLLVWVLIPCLVLGSVGGQSIQIEALWGIGLAAMAVVLGCGLVTWLVFWHRPERRALLLPTMFMNSANMAFPLALLAYGELGLTHQVIFYVAINILHVTLGVAIASKKRGLGEIFRLPLIYTAVIALALAASGHPLPEAVVKPLNLVGRATIPLMLLLLGSRLLSTRLKQVGLALAASFIRLAIGLAFGLAMVALLDLDSHARAAVLIGSAMPAAVLNFVFSEKYDMEPELVASTVVISTALSIFSIPFVLWWIGPL